jgi:hypothetical protein
MPTYRNRAQLISNSTYTYWNASDLDTDMSEHPGSPNPALYQDFVIMFEIPSSGGGASLPTSSSNNFDFLIPDGSGGWMSAARDITSAAGYNADEWTTVETIAGTSTASVTRSGDAITLTIESPSSATVQYLEIKKTIELPQFGLYGHVACTHGFFLQVYPLSTYTRTLDNIQKSGSSSTVNYTTTRNGSSSTANLGGLTSPTDGMWWAFRKTGDSMGFTTGTLNTAVSPYIDLEDFQNFNGSSVTYNTTSYQYRTGSTGTYDSLTNKVQLHLGLQTAAATGTYTATYSFLEMFPL